MVSSGGMRVETGWEEKGQLNTLFCLLVGLGPTNKLKAGLGLLELGVHLSYRQMLWHCVEAGFCMRWETGQEERESVFPTT